MGEEAEQSAPALAGGGLRITWAPRQAPLPRQSLLQCLDPAQARQTLHWGRNYLFVGELGDLEVVVKQFRNEGFVKRWRRRLRGSNAERSWRSALVLTDRRLPTPEPVAWVESADPEGPSYYLCRFLAEAQEARYLIRAMNAGKAGERFPELSPTAFLDAAANLARRLHDAGCWHRDFSAGNLLISGTGEAIELSLVDLNRARFLRRIGWRRRLRDLCRLPLHRRGDQARLLETYLGRPATALEWLAYRFYHSAFHGRHRLKNWLRGRRSGASSLIPRQAYPHLERSPEGASARDRIVWDPLSDQPHQHAKRSAKLRVRLSDAGDHWRSACAAVGAAPRIVRRYRALRRQWPRSCPMAVVGVALRPPSTEGQEAVLRALEELGVHHLLLRLHPWEEDHSAALDFARSAAAAGFDLVFALPQNRQLVRQPERWEAAVVRLVESFVPYGRTFQVGQAINRSKWGVWNLSELSALAVAARRVLDRFPAVQMIGPGVIDFEPHYTAAALNRREQGLFFDAVAHFLYVDRRGAPENRQLGFSTLEKVHLLHAIAQTGVNAAGRSWITEVNWPLREGPHSPAGRNVSVDEETQADYLARYYLLAGASGVIERIYWWQLVARGYGLMEPGVGAQLRPRPAFRALATLHCLLGGASFEGTVAAPEQCHLYRFSTAAGEQLIAGWSSAGNARVELPWKPCRVVDRDGRRLGDETSEVSLSVRYFLAGDAPSVQVERA